MTPEERREALADVTSEQIVEQRAKGWPDFHPEDYCHRCGRPNVVWFVDSELWNVAEPDRYIILCPICFVQDYESATNERPNWRVAIADKADWPSALIQSEAAMRHELEAAKAEIERLRELVRVSVQAEILGRADERRRTAEEIHTLLEAAVDSNGMLGLLTVDRICDEVGGSDD